MSEKQSPKSKRRIPKIFDMADEECLWSQIGALAPRLCTNAFDCLSCPVDRLMQKNKESTEKRWDRERWLNTPANERYCRHMLSGRVGYKLCVNGYNCSNCAFDQMIDDKMIYRPQSDDHLLIAAGFMFARDYYYHLGHMWARVEYGGRIRVGVDDLAARLFGPADEYDLPLLGASVALGERCSAFRRDDNFADLLSPITGVVIARNPRVMERGAEVVDGPYNHGWLFLLEPTRLQRDLRQNISGIEVSPWFERESQRLSDMLTAETGQRLAATGSRVLPDVYGSMPGLDWNKLADAFLRP